MKKGSTSITLAVLASSLALVSGACGSLEEGIDDGPVQPTSGSLKSHYYLNYLWPHSAGGSGPSIIPICFWDGDFSTAQQQNIRQLIEDGWERAAFVDFSGWADCGPFPSLATVTLLVDPTILYAAETFPTGYWPNDYKRVWFKLSSPLDAVVLHEFGHVLGFDHETNTDCTLNTLDPPITPDDPGLSVMQANMTCFTGSGLSAWDILGVRWAYGSKPPGTIVGLGGQSPTVAGGSAAVGATIIGGPATGSEGSTWQRNGLLLQTSIAGLNRCLTANIAPWFRALKSWSCAPSSAAQQFHFLGVQWRAMGKMCIAANSSNAGAKLSLAACDPAAPLQKWDFFENTNQIRLNNTNWCVTVPGGSLTLGNQVVLWSCQESPLQSFSVSAGRMYFGNLCLNVLGGTTAAGSTLGLWDGCDAVPPFHNEVFTISGRITVNGQCVARSNSAPQDGAPIGTQPCQAGDVPTQTWEYVF